MSIHLLLLVLAFVLALLAAFNTPAPPRLNLGWLAFAFFLLSALL